MIERKGGASGQEHVMQMDSSARNSPASGVPSDTPRARQKKYEQRALEAIAAHRFWDMLWAELARDYNATVMNILQMWRNVDVHFQEHLRHRLPH
jgi:serine acetyltransferase